MKILILLTLLIISGCSSVPLSTMVQHSGISEKELINFDAESLRVKIQTDSPVEVGSSDNKLSIELVSEGEVKTFSFALENVSSSIIEEDGWLSGKRIINQVVLKLNSESVAEFRELQREVVHTQQQPKKFFVPFQMENIEQTDGKVVVSIFIKQNKKAEYIHLIDRHEIEVEFET